MARDGLNKPGVGETRGLDGVELVVAIGALHTAGREGDVRDGGGRRDATALSGEKSVSRWWAGDGEAGGGGGSLLSVSVVLAVVLFTLLACSRPMDFLNSATMDLSI